MNKAFNITIITAFCVAILGSAAALAATKPTELRFAIWDSFQQPAAQQIINKFEANNPDIKITIELTPWDQYWVKLSAAASGGVVADVFWMSMEAVSTYAKNGLIEPIDSYLQGTSVDLSDYPEYAANSFNVNGKQYGIPRDVDAIGVWYNKALFDAAGVEYPKVGWSWDDMTAKAAQIRAKSDDFIFPIMMDLGEGQNSYFNFIIQSGSDIISSDKKITDLASDKSISVFRRVQALMAKNYMPSAQQISELETSKAFQANRVAMAYGGSWLALPYSNNPAINDHIGVVPMPKIERAGGVSHSIGYVMSANSDHKQQAWRFMAYLASDEAQMILGASRTVIPAKLSAEDAWFNAFDNLDVSSYRIALQEATAMPTAGNTQKWQSILADGMKRIWLGSDPESVMPSVVKRVQRVLDRD